MTKTLFTKNRLMCPGPTPVPDHVKFASLDTSVYHRSEEFYSLFLNSSKMLRPAFECKNNPIILLSSGSGGMEAAVSNFTNEGDEVCVISAGKFGQRWQKINAAYRNTIHTLEIEWGRAPSPHKVKEFLAEHPGCKAIYFQAHETSTGVRFPIEQICSAIRESYDGLIVVDAISYLIADKLKQDDWGIDVVVAGSQKGFGIPAGLSFISLSDKAINSFSNRPRFYFDLEKEFKEQQSGKSAFTPGTTLIQNLHASLKTFEKEGFDKVIQHHSILANATRSAIKAIGLELLTDESCYSNTLTAIQLPKGIDGKSLIKLLREEYGAFYAGGQDQLAGKIVRISHLGFIDSMDIVTAISTFELGLYKLGHKFDVGLGAKTAINILASN